MSDYARNLLRDTDRCIAELATENARLHFDRAHADCIRCWHPRHRHIDRAGLETEPCDEPECGCRGFVDRKELL